MLVRIFLVLLFVSVGNSVLACGDTDNSHAKLLERQKAAFARSDRDHNSKLSLQEYVASFPGWHRMGSEDPPVAFKSMDTDKSFSLSFKEWKKGNPLSLFETECLGM